MKKSLFILLMMIAPTAIVSNAQIAKPVSDDAKSSEKIIQNAPFSAEAVTESVQILWDGTKIVRKMSSKLFRDREGRFRREDSKMQLGMAADNFDIAEKIFIIDPVAGLKFELDMEARMYERKSMKPRFELNKNSDFKLQMNDEKFRIKMEERGKQEERRVKQEEERVKEQERRIQQEEKHEQQSSNSREQKIEIENNKEDDGDDKKPKPTPVERVLPVKKPVVEIKADKTAKQASTESLGVKEIEGVTVEGTRVTTVIPVGTIGNDRDIKVVYEKWYSKELQLTVYSKHTDPRFGEQIYRLTNLSRDNPPMSLFQPPADFENEDGDKDKRVNKPRAGVIGKPPFKLAEPETDIKTGSKPKLPDSPKKAPKVPKAPKKADDKDKKPVI